ncbi:MAG: hypothetical protein P1U77_12795 [Rubripirellula sp.]|nr:hypothetical protein [Rubripirellula sp.]
MSRQSNVRASWSALLGRAVDLADVMSFRQRLDGLIAERVGSDENSGTKEWFFLNTDSAFEPPAISRRVNLT